MAYFGNYEAIFNNKNEAWEFHANGDIIHAFKIADLFPSGIYNRDYCVSEKFAEQIYHSLIKKSYNQAMTKESSSQDVLHFSDNELKAILAGIIDHMPVNDEERIKMNKMASDIKNHLVHRSHTIFDNAINYLENINKEYQDPRINDIINKLDNVRFLD